MRAKAVGKQTSPDEAFLLKKLKTVFFYNSIVFIRNASKNAACGQVWPALLSFSSTSSSHNSFLTRFPMHYTVSGYRPEGLQNSMV